jgi:rhodanese-related sulfurtransferase
VVEEIDVHRFAAAHAQGAFVIDVREPWEYWSGHVPGARLMPLGTLHERGYELPDDETVFVICASGNRSKTAAAWLTRMGRSAVSVAGGTRQWMDAGHPTVQGQSQYVS